MDYMEGLSKRVLELEELVNDLNERVKILEAASNQANMPDDSDWKRNTVADYMIKVVYPGIYAKKDKPVAGFPKNRQKTSENIQVGQYMFLYATSPEKKIIGLTKATSSVHEVGGRWPYQIDLEWVVGPKPGITFKEIGLDIRPLPGDTIFSLKEEKAQELIQALKSQPDLDQGMIDYLAKKYED